MNTAALHSLFLDHSTITTDSRHCPRGSIFFALKGAHFNGNLFAEKALEAGCAYAVVDEWPEDKPVGERIIMVDDVLQSLQKLANYHRRKLKIPIIGITGTNGKTTTKELIAIALSREFRVAYTKGNLNNQIGVPLTLLSMDKSHEIGVVEMGASHPGDIRELCDIAEPNYGLITNVGKAHLEGFGTFEHLVATKGELYDYIREKEGKVFVNKENTTLYALSEGMDRILYGTNDASLFASGRIANATPFLEFDWSFFDSSYRVKTNLVGEFNFENAIAAVAVSKFFGINAERISAALEAYEPKNNRSQFKRTAMNDLIIDAYNANPTSMMAAIDNFKNIGNPHKAVILGSMKELGDQSMEEHQKVIQALKLAQVDLVYLIGKEFEACGSPFETFVSTNAFLDFLQQHPIQSHLILIKGSRSNQLETLIPHL